MQLRAGKVHLTYDRGFLRYIKVGTVEVLRLIYFALRDHNWDTMPGYIIDEKINTWASGFSISYRWISQNPKFPFEWDVSIVGREDNEIIFTIDGASSLDVLKNRAGFCILHTIKENAGGACVIIHPDGSETEGTFPKYISPHQPFFNIKAMQWPLGNLGQARLDFAGDTFETEDQRNWTDDSYKTYCTPLNIPFPALLKKNEQVHQEVRLTFDLVDETNLDPDAGICQLIAQNPLPVKPRIGFSYPDTHQFSGEEKKLMIDMAPDHLRMEVHLSESGWQDKLAEQIETSLSLASGLELWLFFSTDYRNEISLITKFITMIPADRAVQILILKEDEKCSPSELLDKVVPILRDIRINIKLGAGTPAYFTELNRERVQTRELDFISYSVNPQVHAFDNASMIENAHAQMYSVESARIYFPDMRIHVSPITLKPRFNPNATAVAEPSKETLPEDVDLRQNSLFAAGWTLSSLMHLAEAGADLVTYFEAVGWRGIMQGSELPSNPLFPAQKNMLFPVFHILQCFLKYRKGDWIPFSSSKALDVEAMGFKQEEGIIILIANHLDIVTTCELSYPATKFRFLQLDENNLKDSFFNPEFLTEKLKECDPLSGPLPKLTLSKHAIAFLELFN
ncbi:MAG: hypothetical protein KDC53_07365 [Saprospiraceae bacterium]|nr:hypothetical protein [Saprospiraceae bacterium]